MTPVVMILSGGLLMSLIALLGGVALFLPSSRRQRLLIPLVSLAAGSLLGGALFHMLPEGMEAMHPRQVGIWIALGFTVFLALEQFLHWHHSHRNRHQNHNVFVTTKPVGLLILLGDGLHNLIGGLGIASTYLIHPAAGVAAWIAAVVHEIPQELGDFGVLMHSGWSPRRALVWNFISALAFPVGALLAWRFQQMLPLAPLVLFAAGNFLYIAASDLVPEIKAQVSLRQAAGSFGWFAVGLLLLFSLSSR
jgi:zinc and cadmium transporter